MNRQQANELIADLLKDPETTKTAFALLSLADQRRFLDFLIVPTDTHLDKRVRGQKRLESCWHSLGAIVDCTFDRTAIYCPSDPERKHPRVDYRFDEAREEWFPQFTLLGPQITLAIFQLWEK